MAIEPFQPIKGNIGVQVKVATERAYLAALAELNHIAHDIREEARQQAPRAAPEDDPNPEVNLTDENTSRVEEAVPGRPTARVVFEAPYATKQHEYDFKHPQGGKPKFLEDPLKQAIPTMEARIGAAVRRVI